MIIPTLGWPIGSSVKPDREPDWSWRADDIWDERSEKDRPKETQLESISGDPQERTMDALRKIASRHIAQAKKVNFTRQILFKVNLGLVTFEKEEERLHVLHNMYAVGQNGKKGKIQEQELFALHKIPLSPSPTDERPALQTKKSPTNG